MAFYHVGGCDCPMGCCDCGIPTTVKNKFVVEATSKRFKITQSTGYIDRDAAKRAADYYDKRRFKVKIRKLK